MLLLVIFLQSGPNWTEWLLARLMWAMLVLFKQKDFGWFVQRLVCVCVCVSDPPPAAQHEITKQGTKSEPHAPHLSHASYPTPRHAPQAQGPRNHRTYKWRFLAMNNSATFVFL